LQLPPILLAVPYIHLQIEVLRRPVEFAEYLSIRYGAELAAAGIAPSVGSVGDSYDNAAGLVLLAAQLGVHASYPGTILPAWW
jgi:hypothetical protein